MKNYMLLLLFFVALGFLFVTAFVPKIEIKNNIDQLNYSLYEVSQRIPDSVKVFLLPTGKPTDTEIYYKTQFILAPRVVVFAKYGDIPSDSYILSLQGVDGSLKEDSLYPRSERLYSAKDYYFRANLLKKAE